MNPLDIHVFGNEPWWVVLIKVVLVFVLLLVVTIFNVWYERRLVGKMQHRLGPIMNGPGGLGQALADGAKLIFKEDFRPAGTDKWIFNIAPMLTGVAAFTSWSVIPLAGRVPLPVFNWSLLRFEAEPYYTPLQVTDLPVAVLFVLAIASIGIYGIVLAGWASSSTYSLLGGLRATAQMISYEIAMGLSLVAVFLYSQSMSTSAIVDAQQQPILANVPFLSALEIPGWYSLLLLPSCIVYMIAMVAECNRAPFDLVECEQELVSGFLTDYSGFRYAIYFLAEYINMATVSAVATTLFFGGYHIMWPFSWVAAHVPGMAWLDSGWMGVVWFLGKVLLFIAWFVWLRGTLPRFKYDQLMDLGWKVLLPVSLAWIVLVAVLRTAMRGGGNTLLLVLGGFFLLALAWFVISWLRDRGAPDEDEDQGEMSRSVAYEQGEFDPFAGGYPVPPMPGQVIPELAGVLRGSADTSRTAADTTPMSEKEHI